ncbi:MAG: hypothetical protein MSA66_06260, partial [Oscillospiraceae bacterium]|nr:hypothetical protein [Oscillospiraceae bacterium]
MAIMQSDFNSLKSETYSEQRSSKITSTPKGWATKPKERLSYYLYFCGQNAIYNLVASFLTTYLMLSIGG